MSDDRPSVWLRDVEVDGRITDVVTDGDLITSVGSDPPTSGAVIVVDGQGGALLPGLHDHHVHLLALAAALDSVAVGPADVSGVDGLRAALLAADQSDTGAARDTWLRAVGYHERVAGELDRWALDRFISHRPVRVQHRSGAAWMINTPGLAALGLLDRAPPGHLEVPDGVEVLDDGTPTGRLFGLDRWLAGRVGLTRPDVGRAGDHLVGMGITGVTDATPVADADGMAALAAAAAGAASRRASGGGVMPTVTVTGAPTLSVDTIAAPLRVGPAKLLYGDHRSPRLDEVVAAIRSARANGRAIAVHCVTRVGLVVTLAAFDEVGSIAGDRIEHGAVVPAELYDDIRRLGLTVVTQPNFVAERGDDYLRDVDPDDVTSLWPCASLIGAGIAVGFGSDAPFGSPNPWRLLHAATRRTTPSGQVVGAGERLPPDDALTRLLSHPDRPGGPRRRIEPGAPADLCLLHEPLAPALAALPDNPVRAVVVGGHPPDYS